MARYHRLLAIILLSVFSSVICEECITYDFENDYENLFTNEVGMCVGMQPWILGDYSSNSIDAINPKSNSFISPNTGLSCVSSFSFTMEANGVVEANVYMDATSSGDVLMIDASSESSSGNDASVGSIILSAADPNFVSGWRVLRLTLSGSGVFNGYISILGLAGEGSTILVDSFRYIPPSIDEESCVIYESDVTTTTGSTTESATDSTADPTTDSTAASTTDSTADSTTDLTADSTTDLTADFTTDSTAASTTDSTAASTTDSTADSSTDSTAASTTDSTADSTTDSTADTTSDATVVTETITAGPDVINADCVTYNFELDFNNLVNYETALCEDYLPWNHGNFTSYPIDSPNLNSELLISPNELPSCIASFVFTMTPQGVVEANVYMEPKSELDYIIVLAMKVVPNGIDTVAGFYMYYPTSEEFVTGWNTLRFSVDDFGPFNGYLTFIGTAAEGSVVLIDSFRYMSPTALNDEESCSIY